MANKKSSSQKGSSSKRLASFNRSQEIYKLLEKGIIESEALLGSAVDRPEDDAHMLDLLNSTTGESGRAISSSEKHTGKSPSKKKKR